MIVQANALHLPIASGSVQTVVTSPPYWGLRDYGTATWEGGEAGCDHVEKRGTTRGGLFSTITGGQDIEPHVGQYRNACAKCGARRIDAQLGLERTPEEYVASMVDVFREVWRVLRDDGTVWINLGDSYAANVGGKPDGSNTKGGVAGHVPNAWGGGTQSPVKRPDWLKPKDLIGIPWRFAFALQKDGWYLRSDIIWAKSNPMPESVTDRPTKSHEYIFLLAKSARYYYDADAIKEPFANSTANDSRLTREGYDVGRPERGFPGQASRGAGLIIPKAYRGSSFTQGKTAETKPTVGQGQRQELYTRNKRSVWTISTQPWKGAHFATMPEKLIEPCILAGSRHGDLVLDPFVGSGTVIRVARRLQRRAVGCDLNFEYLREQAKKRSSKVQVEMQYAAEGVQ